MAEIRKTLSDWLFPRDIKCIVCGDELRKTTRYGVCDACTLDPIVNCCSVCGKEVPPQNDLCDHCREEMPVFTEARSCFSYKDASASLVWRLKYRNARYLAPYMAEFMTDTFLQTDWKPDLITFVPLHKSREKQRGYNQSRLLAEELARHIHIPVCETLTKKVKTKNLVKLSGKERSEIIAGSFV
ncbi:MAG: double zinc ribbon domain-containing protein, partial [Clostridiales bacterium]|nr:double zinc ribbon domain-containing protein [Clostridiales bacterium]